ncbi:MAG: Nif3-like dinuclear metal center hexameric protein [Thiotrichales bacterium]|nr:Nif3-like dinuclear metal center hexameric protein [Thiotrichales bacterium]
MQTQALVSYLDQLLEVALYQDYAPNGLQVEGKVDIRRIVTGVTASQALIEAAIAQQADAILVHHGYFWKNEPAQIVGFKQRRIKALLQHDINLLAYHLPLDDHAELGNNAQLAKLWGLTVTERSGLVCCADLAEPLTVEDFYQKVSDSLEREPLWLKGGPAQLRRIAWCSGGAQGYVDRALALGADLYLSGEVSEQNCHFAVENGMHYFAAGHHATERLGVKALGEHLQQVFDLEVQFIDIANPV